MTPDHSCAALYIGALNSEHVFGMPWRFLSDRARELGVEPILIGTKRVFRARELAEAFEREAARAQPEPEIDAREELRRRLAGT